MICALCPSQHKKESFEQSKTHLYILFKKKKESLFHSVKKKWLCLHFQLK